jgi:hypothetical protein
VTSRQLFEYALIELNKVQAPSLILEDYNYFINKAVNQYINKVYNLYDINQQKSDDLRVLKSSAVLSPTPNGDYGNSALFNKTYDLDLPDDYLHVLNCVVEYTVSKNFKCYDANDKVHFGAKRLTADMFSQIINNYYMRPSYKNPYFYINNVNISNNYPTSDNQVDIDYTPLGTDLYNYSLPKAENIEKIAPKRYGNKSKVRMEIRYGKDDTLFTLSKVYIDYLKSPQFIRLTQEQVDEVEDKSQILEFPDYVCQEITNELIKLLMENGSDPRLQTNIPVNQTIANPAQEQQKR